MKLNAVQKIFHFQGSLTLGREESCSGSPTEQTKGLCWARSLLSKYLTLNNQKKARQSRCVFLPRPFPSINKKRSKKKRSQEESQVQSRAVPEPWSLERCQASWQEIRRACDGNLPVFHRKFIQTETLLRNILLTTNRHSLTKKPVLLETSQPGFLMAYSFL